MAIGDRFGDISDLPEELKSQLKQWKVARGLEAQIIEVIKEFAGFATLDEILVGLYRKYTVILTRDFLVNKLYRMGHKNIVKSIKGKKGVYRLEDYELD